ncbi:MAG: hypothetical protein H5T84_11515, partial [Thermoleophilia bacterium]|nr:hypothetical protein [Thermoleophilia bacterium]
MKNSHSQQKSGLKRLALLLLVGSLSATLLAGCGDKPAPEQVVSKKTVPENQGTLKSPPEKPGEKAAE